MNNKLIEQETYKGLKNIVRITYKNGFKFKYYPYMSILCCIGSKVCLTASANGECEEFFKGLDKSLKEICIGDMISTYDGILLKVIECDDFIIKVFNGVNIYNININEVEEVFNGR